MMRMQDSNKNNQDGAAGNTSNTTQPITNTAGNANQTPAKTEATTETTAPAASTSNEVTPSDTKSSEQGVTSSDTTDTKKEAGTTAVSTSDTSVNEAEKTDTAQTSEQPDTKNTDQPVVPAAGTVAADSVTKGSNRPLLAFIAGIIVAVGGWYLYGVLTTPAEPDPNRDYADPIATVNGDAVDQDLFYRNLDQTFASLEAQGLDTTDPSIRESYEIQVLDTIVNTKLLIAAAAEAGYEPTDEEIQARITDLEAQFGDAAGLDVQLENLGLNRDSLYEDVREQLSVDALLEGEVLGDNLTVTDQELEDAYNALLEAGRELPELDAIRDALAAQIEQQKQQQLIGNYIDSLRAEAEIETNL
jgi:hypothetical protein